MRLAGRELDRRAVLGLVEHGAGLAALALALAVNFLAGRAASQMGAQNVRATDFVLTFLPVLDLRLVFTWGFGTFIAAIVGWTFWKDRDRAGWFAWCFALTIYVRSLCLLLTPLHAPAGALWADGDALYDRVGRYMTFQHDLFFSSHTAMPFLAFLLVRPPWLKIAFLLTSVALAATVLFTRLHYSIDVAAAYAFTYAVYHANRRFLRTPYRAWRRSYLKE